MVGAAVFDHHLATGQSGGDEKCRHHQPVGDDGVGGGVELVDPFDFDPRCARAGDVRPHGIEELSQITDLGLAGCILDDGGPLGQHGGHEHVVGTGVAGVLEDHAVPDQARHRRHRRLHPGLDVAVGRLERSAHRLEGTQVHVDGPGPEVVSARQRDLGPPAAAQEGARTTTEARIFSTSS